MGIMSENSELIHWHLQRRSAALFGGAAREGGPVVANSALPHPQQQLGCHLPLEASRLRRERGGGPRFNEECSLCFIGSTFICPSWSLQRFKKGFDKADFANKVLQEFSNYLKL